MSFHERMPCRDGSSPRERRSASTSETGNTPGVSSGATRTASGTSDWTTSGRVDFPPQADNNKHSRQAPNKEKRRDTADYPHATG